MAESKVSVIVPAFNVEAYLRRTLDSLLAQTLREIEIVIVDDGSTDHTGAIAETYAQAHPDRVVLVRKPNGGLSDARNSGVARSSGAFIGFVDADDTVEPEMFAKLYELAVDNDCEVAICRYVHEDADGGNATIGGVFPFAEGEVFGPEGFFLNSHVMMVCNKIYRRELVERFPQPHTWFEDIAWTPIVMSQVRRICSTPEAYYRYVRRPDSIAYSHRDPRTLQGIDALRQAMEGAGARYRDEVLYMAAQRLRFEAKRRRLYADRYMTTLHELRAEVGNSRCVLNDTRLYTQIARYLREDFRPIPQHVVAAQLNRELTAREQRNRQTWADPLCAPGSALVVLGTDDIPDTEVARALVNGNRPTVLEDYLKLRYVGQHGGVALCDSVVARRPFGWALHPSSCFFALADERRLTKAIYGATPGHSRIGLLLALFERFLDKADPLQAALDELLSRADADLSNHDLDVDFGTRYLTLGGDTRVYASGQFCNDFGADLATTYVYPNSVDADDLTSASPYFRNRHHQVIAKYQSWGAARAKRKAKRLLAAPSEAAVGWPSDMLHARRMAVRVRRGLGRIRRGIRQYLRTKGRTGGMSYAAAAERCAELVEAAALAGETTKTLPDPAAKAKPAPADVVRVLLFSESISRASQSFDIEAIKEWLQTGACAAVDLSLLVSESGGAKLDRNLERLRRDGIHILRHSPPSAKRSTVVVAEDEAALCQLSLSRLGCATRREWARRMTGVQFDLVVFVGTSAHVLEALVLATTPQARRIMCSPDQRLRQAVGPHYDTVVAELADLAGVLREVSDRGIPGRRTGLPAASTR